MHKEDLTVVAIPPGDLPLNKHWSWDRILRSPFIKQADVAQGLYFQPDRFDREIQRRNFDFYEAAYRARVVPLPVRAFAGLIVLRKRR